MNNLIDLKRQLSVIGIKSCDQKGNYRSAADIYKDIGVVYQKFYNAGVSTSDMKLLDRICYDIVRDWDRLVQQSINCCDRSGGYTSDRLYYDVMKNWDQIVRKYNESFESCSDGTQTLEDKGAIGEYKEMVGRTDQEFIQLM